MVSVMNSDSALVDALKNHGEISSPEQLAAIAKAFPMLRVGVKMGCSQRFCVPAKDVQDSIDSRVRDCADDYARDIFITSGDYDSLREIFQLTD